MRIGINLLAIIPNTSGGIEVYVYNLIKALSERDDENIYFLFVNKNNIKKFLLTKKNFNLVRVNISGKIKCVRIFFEHIYLPILAKKYRLDLLHTPSGIMPLFKTVRNVITICDMLYKAHPGKIEKSKLYYYRLFIPLSARRCDKVVTLSEHSKMDIINYLQISDKKIEITKLAFDDTFMDKLEMKDFQHEDILRKYGVKKPYILDVGGIGRHKNFSGLIEAFRILKFEYGINDLLLVIAGNDYGVKKEIELLIKNSDINNRIIIPGYVGKDELASLYRGAFAYVTPSFYEGFGLTVLEAMAFGTPVIASNKASLPEVAGDAAIYFDPNNFREIAAAIYRIVNDNSLREKMIMKGFKRVGQFSWERTAEKTIEVYKEVTKNS